MKVETIYNHIRYTLSNDNLEVNDQVYPIANGRCLEDGSWILHEIEFRSKLFKNTSVNGFPYEPHTILDLNYDNGRQGKAYQVRTNHGYGPIETYYKIVKMEKQIDEKKPERIFSRFIWVELNEEERSEVLKSKILEK